MIDKYNLNNLLYPVLNNPNNTPPSLFSGYHELYIISSGKDFNNTILAYQYSEELVDDNLIKAKQLYLRSHIIFESRIFRLIEEHKNNTTLLIGYLDSIVKLRFEDCNYNVESNFKNLPSLIIYELKRFLNESSVFKNWYQNIINLSNTDLDTLFY